MTGTPSCRVAEIACSSESRADWVIDPASGEAMAMIPERFARRVAELLRIESCVREYLTYLLAITDMSLPSDEHTRLVESKVRDVIMPRFIGAQPTREDTTRWASRIEQAERLERTMDEFARNFPTSPKTVRVLEAIRCLASLRLVFMRLRFGTALNCASLAGLAIRDGFTISSVHELCRWLAESGYRGRTAFAQPEISTPVLSVGIISERAASGHRPYHAFVALPSIPDPATPVTLEVNGYAGDFRARIWPPLLRPGQTLRYLSPSPTEPTR